ncbi:DUF6491 family protein [Hyphomonas sp. FCG-A18]|uniref:DUF6491 family protein n=1 Tax=Hyphomonas sp. FCG-A18 TaxID=3080019 RepID=UPI002B2F51C6|nr:DUF6491 family protein [Hyphomonas sp. FCG-A18]
MKKIIIASALTVSALCLTMTTAVAETEASSVDRKAAAKFEGDIRRGEEVGKLCFPSQIHGFVKTTERAVIVQHNTKEYLITTRHRCNSLERANSLTTEGSLATCLRRGDKISGQRSIGNHGRAGGLSNACFIDKIYEWNSDASEVAAVSDRVKAEG